jgi:NAD(P)-dependent dehydrogenase (short-subunit alcohol dehydrogenase family)
MSLAEQFRLDDQVALVTGAASGLGVQFAEAMAEAGAHVVLADTNEEGLERTAQMVRELDREALVFPTDVTDEEQVGAAFARTAAHFGRLDVLFNNAGIADPEPFLVHEYPTDQWRRVLNVDLEGVFLCAREALKIMVPRRRGKVVNTASMWGLSGSSSLFPAPAYTAAKGAVVNLTRELGLQYATHNIQVNALCPGFFRSNLGGYDDPDVLQAMIDFTPMGRVAETAEIKGPALFLASAASDYMTGQTLVVDGGCLAK